VKERKFEESATEVLNNGVSSLILFIVPAFTFYDFDADLNTHKIEFVPTIDIFNRSLLIEFKRRTLLL